MTKRTALAVIAVLLLLLTGCGKTEQEQLMVYSFSGKEITKTKDTN